MLAQLVSALPAPVLERRLEAFVAAMAPQDRPAVAIHLWNGRRIELAPRPRVVLRARHPRALTALLRASLDALGDAYVGGDLDVEGTIDDVFDTAVRLAGTFGPPARSAHARPRSHTRRIDADAISYHYDVSNDFYRLWLDPEMVYSCAYFRDPADGLEAAQIAKLDHILTKLRVQPGERFLDIGCGWGALILRAAREYGARALGVTLSHRQYEHVRARIEEEGLEGRCEVRLQDYRDLTGHFDRIASVGMFEHVGLKNLRTYFGRIHELLADGGLALNHGITSTDPGSGEVPFGGGRFIGRYVFPHGELPHIGLALTELSAAGLEATDVENLRHHYALTLRHWSARFERNAAAVREIAGERRFRIWRVYLAGCAYGFAQHWVAIHQILACKPAVTGRQPHPLTRDYMYAGR